MKNSTFSMILYHMFYLFHRSISIYLYIFSSLFYLSRDATHDDAVRVLKNTGPQVKYSTVQYSTVQYSTVHNRSSKIRR